MLDVSLPDDRNSKSHSDISENSMKAPGPKFDEIAKNLRKDIIS